MDLVESRHEQIAGGKYTAWPGLRWVTLLHG